MNSREAFEKWYSTLPAPYKEDFMNTPSLGEWAAKGFNAGYASCEQHYRTQSEPVCYVDPENVDMASHKDMWFRFNVCTKNEKPFTHPLFAHAMPKSDSAINELIEAVDDVLEKAPCDCSHKMRYENGEHLSSCYLFDLNIASLKTNATPQPTTDISELIAAMNEVIRISDRDRDAWNKVKALIAKHTVKA